MDKKIINGYVAEYENGVFTAKQKDIYVIDGKLSFSGDDSQCEVIDARDRLIMPGLINLHTHAYMTLFRNYADDVSFDEWLFRRIMPVEDVIGREDAYWTNLLGMIEMIESGTTCFSDMHMFEGQSCKAAKEAGLRAYIGRGLVGDGISGDGAGRIGEALRERAEYECDTIKFVLSPHAIYSCSEKLYSQVAELAKKEGLLIQTHLSESVKEVEDCYANHGISPVELLDRAGFLENAILAHCVQVSDNDIDLIHSRNATVVTNPASNAKLGNGIAPIKAMREHLHRHGRLREQQHAEYVPRDEPAVAHAQGRRARLHLPQRERGADNGNHERSKGSEYGGQPRYHRRGSVRRPHIPRPQRSFTLPEQRRHHSTVLLGERLGGSLGNGQRQDADEGPGAPHDRQGARIQRGTQDSKKIFELRKRDANASRFCHHCAVTL